MSDESASTEAVMAVLHKLPQPPAKGRTAKLASVEIGTPEAYYLLATYCFDLTRKLEYLVQITRRFAARIPPDLAEQIDEDTATINNPATWQQRAIAAEAVMLRLFDENSGYGDGSQVQATSQPQR